jgi:hypothetical protein
MNEISRKHHFLSTFYLARFTDTGTKDGTLWVFDSIANKVFQNRPKNVAYELDFNRVELDGRPPDILETAFGEFEGKAASVIQRICRDGELPEGEEFGYVLKLIALFGVRNPAMRRSMKVAWQHEDRVIADLLASDRSLYEHHVQQARDAGFVSGTGLPFEQFQESVWQGDQPPIHIGPQEHLQIELAALENILTSVSSRYWSLLVATPDAPDFITCDHPVSLIHKQVVFPLDTRHALMGERDHPVPRTITLHADGVAEVNLRMLKLAKRQVYSRTSEIVLLDDGKILKVPR